MEKLTSLDGKTGFLKALSRKAEKTSKAFGQRTNFWRPGETDEIPRHAGKGPKNYRRPDARIFEDVCEYLTQDPHIDASHLEVRVENGVVTLFGTVESLVMKQAANDCARSAPGVVAIHNDLDVKHVETRTSEL